MIATDTLWMSALIFTPTVFALVLVFVPKRSVEAMRWLALFGTAITLAISIVVLLGYLEQPGVATPGSLASLEHRVDAAAASEAAARPADSADWVARLPWIRQFNIDYFLGVD